MKRHQIKTEEDLIKAIEERRNKKITWQTIAEELKFTGENAVRKKYSRLCKKLNKGYTYSQPIKGLDENSFLNLVAKERAKGSSWPNIARRLGDKSKNAGENIRKKVARLLKRKEESKIEYATTKPRQKIVITSALNNCPINQDFYKCLNNFIKNIDAELRIIPLYYKNYSLFSKNEEYWWPKEFNGHYIKEDVILNKNLLIAGSLHVNATAIRPLTGHHKHGHNRSFIAGHPTIESRVSASPRDILPKKMTTTGTISLPQYTDSNAGYKAKQRHSYSAIVIEYQGDKFWMRRINYDPEHKCIYDLTKAYYADTIEDVRPEALTLGDLHAPYVPDYVFQATFSKTGLINQLRPKKVFFHDIFDCLVGSPHAKSPVLKHLKKIKGLSSVKEELEAWAKQVEAIINNAEDDIEFYVVRSNHDEHLDRWLDDFVPNGDPENLLTYATLLKYKLEHKTHALEAYWRVYNSPVKDKLRFLDQNTSFIVEGVDFGQHGHLGPNGSRGSLKSFDNSSTYVSIGHSHTEGEYGKSSQVGTNGPLDPSYAKGYSSWMHTDRITYKGGTGTLITLIEEKYF